MLTFENDPSQKKIILEQLQTHYDADEIVKGQYWENGKGCAVGCILHSDNHSEFEERFNIPEWFARLIDEIFEELPNEEAKEFPINVWKAIPERKNLDRVKWKFNSFLMDEVREIILGLKDLELELREQVLNSIQLTKEVNKKALKTGVWETTATGAARAACAASAARSACAARSARSAACAARSAACAAYAAAGAYADSAARAARAVAYVARAAAGAYADSAAAEAARSARAAAYSKYSKKLIKILHSLEKEEPRK